MPLNPITAASYSILRYTVTHTNQQHAVRLYFDEVPVLDLADSETVFEGYTDADHTTGWSLQSIWTEVLSRYSTINGAGGLPDLRVDSVEVWQGDVNPNVFLWLDPDDYSALDFGGSSVAAAYGMAVLKTSARDQFRFTMFDTNSSNPQRFVFPTPPLEDDDSFAWFMLRSVVGFTNYKNVALSNAATFNTGVNDQLASSYGRRIAP